MGRDYTSDEVRALRAIAEELRGIRVALATLVSVGAAVANEVLPRDSHEARNAIVQAIMAYKKTFEEE